jgi:hypothetical protein
MCTSNCLCINDTNYKYINNKIGCRDCKYKEPNCLICKDFSTCIICRDEYYIEEGECKSKKCPE